MEPDSHFFLLNMVPVILKSPFPFHSFQKKKEKALGKVKKFPKYSGPQPPPNRQEIIEQNVQYTTIILKGWDTLTVR